MEPALSKIANFALDEIASGQFPNLPKPAIIGLLNDFQYSWLRRFKIPYKFEMLDIAGRLCNGENRAVFIATQCNSIEDIRNTFSGYIKKWHKNDDRVVLSLTFDGKKINKVYSFLVEGKAVPGEEKCPPMGISYGGIWYRPENLEERRFYNWHEFDDLLTQALNFSISLSRC